MGRFWGGGGNLIGSGLGHNGYTDKVAGDVTDEAEDGDGEVALAGASAAPPGLILDETEEGDGGALSRTPPGITDDLILDETEEGDGGAPSRTPPGITDYSERSAAADLSTSLRKDPPLPSCPSPHRMTAVKPDTVREVDDGTWEFELGFDGNVGDGSTAGLSDSDTFTSAASEVTLKPGRGAETDKNPGPTYASGDIILCDSLNPLSTQGLQRAYVLSADHPNYRLQLEEGVTIDTHTGETWMTPRYLKKAPLLRSSTWTLFQRCSPMVAVHPNICS